MSPDEHIDPQLLPADRLVLEQLLRDVDYRLAGIDRASKSALTPEDSLDSGYASAEASHSEEDVSVNTLAFRQRKSYVWQRLRKTTR